MDITVKFVDFWPTFDRHNNKFLNALRCRHNVKVLDDSSSETPDILFYSRCGCGAFLKYDCLKIYYTGENDVPDFNECDYSISFYDFSFNGRNLRYPLYLLYEYDRIDSPLKISDKEAVSRGFCSVVMRNAENCDPKRLEVIDEVEDYKPLAYGGPYRNNVGGPVDDKIEFISKYKFNLALENSIVDGYVTEKILEPMVASTVPVYWGSAKAKADFNPAAFIDVNDFPTRVARVERLKEIDSDDSRYLEMLRAPKLLNAPDFDSQLVEFLDRIVTQRKRHVVTYGEMSTLHHRKQLLMPLYRTVWSRRAAKALSSLFK